MTPSGLNMPRTSVPGGSEGMAAAGRSPDLLHHPEASVLGSASGLPTPKGSDRLRRRQRQVQLTVAGTVLDFSEFESPDSHLTKPDVVWSGGGPAEVC